MKYKEIILKFAFDKNSILRKSFTEKLAKNKCKYKNIIHFILTFYDNNSSSIREGLYRILYSISEVPKCPICGKFIPFRGKNGVLYGKYCSNKCKGQDKEFHNKIHETCLEKYGEGNLTNREKAKETFINKYGVDNPWKNKEIINNIKEQNIEHFNIGTTQEKMKNTCLNKYGTEWYLQTNEFKEKSINTSLLKYNTKYPIQSKIVQSHYNWDEITEKINLTKKLNNTFNTSNPEEQCYEQLKLYFNNVIRQYNSKEYPFNCDFYISDIDLYIEYNGTWTHGKKPFENTPEDNKILKTWEEKSVNSKFYKNAINVWTKLDVKKRNIAKNNNLNFIELWGLNDLDFLFLNINLDPNILSHEYDLYKKLPGKLSNVTHQNNIIKYFQQDIFYKYERELWLSNKEIRNRLIENRKKYLNKENINVLDILNGFKRSGIYYGFSHFNPLLFKWFIEKYNVKTCYDPCGGWGHRLLGAQDLDLYIYNDLSTSVYNNVNNIIDYFNINNTVTYNNDARCFNPSENYEAIFTCPPYFNIEKYECESFKDINDYNDFIDCLFNNFYNSNAKIFGLVIREDLLSDKYKWNERYEIIINTAYHINKEKQNKEYLYIFTK